MKAIASPSIVANTDSIRDCAERFGFSFVMLRGKKPTNTGTIGKRITRHTSLEEALAWAEKGGNIGVITGSPSNGLFVVDYDPGAVFPDPLPNTPVVRTGRDGLHVYYRLPAGVTLGLSTNNGALGAYIDVRGEGGFAVFPGSVHPETDERYEWMPGHTPEDCDLAVLPDEMYDALKPKPKPKAAAKPTAPKNGHNGNGARAYALRVLQEEAARVAATPERERNSTLNSATMACVFDGWPTTAEEIKITMLDAALACRLPELEARATIQSALTAGANSPRVVPRKPPMVEVVTFPTSPSAGGNTTGKQAATRIVPDTAPLHLAQDFLRVANMRDGVPMIRRYQGQWHRFNDTHYAVEEEESVRARVYRHLDPLRVIDDKGNETPVGNNVRSVSGLLDALPACRGVLVNGDAPTFLDRVAPPAAGVLLPMGNGMLSLATRKLYPHTPSYFSTYALPFDYNPAAPDPCTWFGFLRDLWPDDLECTALLQEWFAYVISGDTRRQKILLMLGPKRSGKGTIARVLIKLMGACNVAAPTLAGLSTNFGLQTLLGKPLAIINDARLTARNDAAIVTERLLSISGEDPLDIDRKYLAPLANVRLPTRIVIVSNEAPALVDPSGALASRYLILPTTRSFYGQEDLNLGERLNSELPGIFNWALRGVDRLLERGGFTEPALSRELCEIVGDLGSPVEAFIRECCAVDATSAVLVSRLFAAWRMWCSENGREHAGTTQGFARNLKAVYPQITTQQVRTGAGLERFYNGVRLKA